MKIVDKNYPKIDLNEIYTEDELQALYNDFLYASDLPQRSADELVLEVTDLQQRRWLSTFIASWEKTEALADESEWFKYADQKSGITR